MTDRAFQIQEKRLKHNLQKMVSSENRIVEMYNDQISVLFHFLSTSGKELDLVEQELIVTAILKFQQLALRGNIFSRLAEVIPHDDTVDEIFDKITSGEIWKSAEPQYIDRKFVWNFLSDVINTHDEDYESNYAWIVDNLENITNCMQRIHMLDPDAELHQLQTEIPIKYIDENRRAMYSSCEKLLTTDFKITNLNRKIEVVIREFLISENTFIDSCKREWNLLQDFKQQYTLSIAENDKIDEALKYYAQLENVWSKNMQNGIEMAITLSNSDFIEEGTYALNRELNNFFITNNRLKDSIEHKKYFESLSWLMINQSNILDIMTVAIGGLDKLNATFPQIKTHAAEINTRLSQINKTFDICLKNMGNFIGSSSRNELILTNVYEACEALTKIKYTLDSMRTFVNRKGKQMELLTDLSKGLSKCKQYYDNQTGGFFAWAYRDNPLIQFINDVNILINCNSEAKMGMLIEHISKNMDTHAAYTDLTSVLKRFLEKAPAHSSIIEHYQAPNLNFR